MAENYTKEITMAQIHEYLIPVWDIEKLQRLKSAIDAEIIQRLLMRRRTRKSKG
jgi:hypothetical protein